MKTEQLNASHLIVSIKDTKSGVFFTPTICRSKADFIRSVQIEAKNPNSMLHKFPADYDLYVVGKWCEYNAVDTIIDDRLGSVLDLCPLS
ncbi:MAG: hypothetical protein [Wigfec virus K19_141]|nr:MAG: hypothetical protein [Wigfec virus K19_141]